MNEKIKQLQNTAGIQVVRTLMRGDENTEVKLMLTQTQLDKFAELIVKETLQVARAGIAYGDGMEDAVYKYFGVEE